MVIDFESHWFVVIVSVRVKPGGEVSWFGGTNILSLGDNR